MDFSIVDEMIEALGEEVKTLKKGKSRNMTPLMNGRFLRETTGLYIYVFALENFLAALDDMPCELEIGGNSHQCHVVSSEGQEIQLALEKYVGKSIAHANLMTNFWFLLELLAKKFKESKDKKLSFATSQRVFAGVSHKVRTEGVPTYSVEDNPLNLSQIQAIEHAFGNSLSVIWGPPGTGKTKTIANLIEAHLRAEHRILLVSHANAAVDQALSSVAKQLKDTPYYEEGKLVRLGVTYHDTLDKEYPLVILKNIVEKQGQVLTQERDQLMLKREKWQALIRVIKQLMDVAEKHEAAKQALRLLEDNLAALNNRIRQTHEQLRSIQKEIDEQQERLVLASQTGRLKRIILRLNPERIEHYLQELEMKYDSYHLRLKQDKHGQAALENDVTTKQQEVSRIGKEMDRLFAKHVTNEIELVSNLQVAENALNQINGDIDEIDKKLDDLSSMILRDSRLVATTLTKTFASHQFPRATFDAIIIDEASMAPLPQVYWACQYVSSYVTIVGDFNQLPPIGVSQNIIAEKWLKRSIFEVIGIDSVNLAERNDNVTLLDTQYRMAPDIANVSSVLFYNNLLKNASNTKGNILTDPLTNTAKPLILVDTSKVNPWSTRLSTSGFFNIYDALVSMSIAKKLLSSTQPLTIGVATPFRAQARLIRKIAEDWGFADRIRVDTIHSFQGGERDVMIIDTVEAQGMGKWSIFNEAMEGSNSDLILNVALTRAKKKVFFISHKVHHTNILDQDFSLCKLLGMFAKDGIVLPSERVTSNYLDIEFDQWVERYVQSSVTDVSIRSSLYTDDSFWGVFLSDLKNAKEDLIIMSPFISMNRTSFLMPFFHSLAKRGVRIRIYTRPPERQGGTLVDHSREAISKFEEYGIKVVLRNRMHQKIALIDDEIAWEGSLNILSHNSTEEQMRRLVGEHTVREIINNLELEELGSGDMTEDICPKCGNRMVVRRGRFGLFLGCSSFPNCKQTNKLM